MQEWLDKQTELGRKASLVYTKEDFDAVDPAETDYLFGLFEPSRMEEETVRRQNNSEPSIKNLTDMAIRILSKNPKGFYLFIEGMTAHCTQRINTLYLLLRAYLLILTYQYLSMLAYQYLLIGTYFSLVTSQCLLMSKKFTFQT